MPVKPKKDTTEAWKKSRSGAWAGRGFHYQHLFSTLVLIRQWAGLAPTGDLIPEGLEDCVIELSGQELWLQVKSRKEGVFSATEVQQILKGVASKAKKINREIKRKAFVVLERPCQNLKSIDVDKLFDNLKEQSVVCTSPHDESIAILTTQLDTAEIVAEGILNDIYQLVASASEQNATLPFTNQRKISTSEIERRIFERLEAEDPSAINRALVLGMLVPISYSPVIEPAFYQGVKVVPGHVAAGLVFDRPADREKVTRMLKQRRHVLISGQSGAGKSALMWSSVKSLSSGLRWYQITSKADIAKANAIIQFLRARRPSKISPIGLAFDEVGSANADLWNFLARELRNMSSIYLLGSIRQEDVSLITNYADMEFVHVSLHAELAESVWEKLYTEGQTDWTHWREPFEQSDGLMLEFVHILTQGRRLASVIEDQIRLRQQEGRKDELAIIRSSAILCACGGEVQVSSLINLLDITPDNAQFALARLIDEHLIRETRPGILGGLHMLRSQALVQASHDQVVYLSDKSLWQAFLAVTSDTLPRVVQSVLTNVSDEDEFSTLHKLADVLSRTQNIDTWTSILTGLGLATVERNIIAFIKILQQHGVQRAHWTIAALFCDPKIDIAGFKIFEDSEQWRKLRDSILAFRDLPKKDLRQICLDKLPKESSTPDCQDLRQANKLLSCLVPICGGEPIGINISTTLVGRGMQDIQDVADFLSTAYLINPDVAKRFVNKLGGEKVLFDWFVAQTPWVTRPKIDLNGDHGRTVRADMFYISEQTQTDPHESICNICEILIAISPESEAAASDAVSPLGQPIAVGDYQPWSKNMPRENIFAEVRVSWNVTFKQIMLAKSTSDSLTEYASNMADLVRRTDKLLRLFSEKWVRSKQIPNKEALAQEANEIIDSVNLLAYAAPKKPAHEMTKPIPSNADQNDLLGTLLTGILDNLVRRMGKIPGDENAKAAAAFAGSLADQAYSHAQSFIWRTNANPPSAEFKALAERLTNISSILHEFAYDNSLVSIQEIIKFAQKSNPGKAIMVAAKRCQLYAEKRFIKKLKSLEKALNSKGWHAKCWFRPIKKADSPYWPPREVAIAIDIEDFETDLSYIEDALSLGAEYLGTDWPFRVVPVVNDVVVAQLAMLPSSFSIALPDNNFAEDWRDYIDLPFLSSQLTEKFDKALESCTQLSAIMACCDLEQLHPKEDDVFSNAIETFEKNSDAILKVAENTDSEYAAWAYEYLSQSWDQVVMEFEAVKEGKAVSDPLCIALYAASSGQDTDQSREMGSIRILLLQAECVGK